MSRATFEATTDGILVTDSKGAITDYNAKFVEMWRLTREVMETRQHKRVLDVTSTRFVEPEQYFARIREIYATSPQKRTTFWSSPTEQWWSARRGFSSSSSAMWAACGASAISPTGDAPKMRCESNRSGCGLP